MSGPRSGLAGTVLAAALLLSLRAPAQGQAAGGAGSGSGGGELPRTKAPPVQLDAGGRILDAGLTGPDGTVALEWCACGGVEFAVLDGGLVPR